MERAMKDRDPSRTLLIIAISVVLSTACASTPDSRISKKQSLFDTYPEEVQTNLRMGKVEVGYDEEMVRLALGEPDETSSEIDDTGETIVWGYTRPGPGISVGLGGGRYGGGTGVGGGVGMGSGPTRDYTAIIEFREGKVTNARYFDN
jgi:hypothetical protein